ncbi:MAG TPA: FecR family protein [Planctomycetota bacterium]|nr:FecR family protein [Planctomycetota bacterium]
MSRVQDLTLKLLDGELNEAGQAELRRLISADPQAADEHIAILELEAALRAEQEIDLTDEILERIQQIAGEKTQKSVLDKIKARSSPAWKRAQTGKRKAISAPVTANTRSTVRRVRRPRENPFGAGLLIAASLAIVLLLALFVSKGKPARESAVALAALQHAPAGTSVKRDGRDISAASGMEILAGDSIRAASSSALLHYSDGTDVSVEAGAEVVVSAPDADAGKRLQLNAGTLRASVAKQNADRPLVIRTPQASVTVLGTRFELALSPGTTRLTVEDGLVGMRRLSDGKSALVKAGHFAQSTDMVALRIGESAPAAQTALQTKPVPQGELAITGFHLVNADTGQMLPGFSPLAEGAIIDLSKLPKLSMVVTTEPAEVGSIVFDVNGKMRARVEMTPPYALTTNWDGNHFLPWNPPAGKHTITATPYAGKDGQGKAGRAMTITFTIVTR